MGKSVPGPLFGSNTSTAGFFYTGTSFPTFYQGKYLHAEWNHQWIKVFEMDANDEPVAISDFLSNGGGIVFATMDPTNGDMYYISWTSVVWRVRYLGSGNSPPTARATATPVSGFLTPSVPLTVQFRGDTSSDPEELPLTYLWNFGDDNTSTLANPSHDYAYLDNGGVLELMTVTLTVTDDGQSNPDETDVDTLTVWLNNEAPVVNITSPTDGSLYSVLAATPLTLTASYSDTETPTGNLGCTWQVSLHHNDHFHTDPPLTTCNANTEIAPLGCDPNATYSWQIELTVTDEHGLSTTDTSTLYPDESNCPNIVPLAIDDTAVAPRGLSTSIDILANDFDSDGTLDPAGVSVLSGPTFGTIPFIDPLTGAVNYVAPVSTETADSFTYTVLDDDGDPSNVATVDITLYNNPPIATLTSPQEGDLFSGGDLLTVAGMATDADDAASLIYDWQIDRIEYALIVPAVYTHTGTSPPDFSIPTLGGPDDHISYRVTLTVTDAAGEQDSDEAWIYPLVAPPGLPPVPDLQATPTSGSPDLLVSFDASGSSDADGDFLRYEWDFGDGSPVETGPTPQHLFSGYVSNFVTLTVTDSMGLSNTAAVSIDTALGGVVGEYFDNMTLTDPPDLVRVDNFIDFNWGSGSPDPVISNNNYSVRWTGQIVPLYDENYTFYLSIDDGGRLWIDGVLVIDRWIDQGETEHASAPIALSAGVPVDFRFEWYENGGGAVARLRWSSPSQTKEIIAASQLQGAGSGNQPPIAVTDSASFDLGGTHLVDVLNNDLDDQGLLDPSSLALSPPLHGSVTFNPGTGIVEYINDSTPTPFDTFSYNVSDTQGEPSNSVMVLLSLAELCGDGVVAGNEACDDGNVIAGDCCSATCAFEGIGASCDDGDACTALDTCDGSGFCLAGAPLVCDNGAFCDGLESCDSGTGCLPGTPPNVDDGIACTIDSCQEGPDPISHVPDDGACDDSDPCTADSCDVVQGCLNDPIPACGTPQVPTFTAWGRVLFVLMIVGLGLFGLIDERRRA
jgi:cysteine-rich repeat protein